MNINVSKKGALPARNVSPLMPMNCLKRDFHKLISCFSNPPSFTFYIFQIEIYGGNLSEEIEYKRNYFLNLSLISEHFARVVFPNQLMAF